jgi:hypothetical protein
MPKKSLDELMSGVKKSNMVSMAPAPREIKKKEPEILRDAEQVIKDKATRGLVTMLAAEVRELGDALAGLNKEKDAKSSELKSLITKLGIEEKFTAGDCKIGMSHSTRSTILMERLLARGIKPDVIASCTETKDVYTLRITRLAEEE